MAPRDFTASLSEATQELGEAMPDEVTRRLRRRLSQGRAPRRVRWERVAGVGVLVLSLALSVHPERRRGTDVASAESLSGPSTSLGANGAVLGAVLEFDAEAQLQDLPDGAELLSGVVTFDVDHDFPRAHPYRVRVSHGVIEVLGTRFTVTQRWGEGEVTLHRGSIRFTSDDGQVRLLAPGETLRWPVVKAAIPRSSRAKSRDGSRELGGKEAATIDVDALLERVALQRSRGEYEAAVVTLTDSLQQPFPLPTAERLSFELGTILSRQLHDSPRACAHWRGHDHRFPRGRYEREVAELLRTCDATRLEPAPR